jgi:hypothetical protein
VLVLACSSSRFDEVLAIHLECVRLCFGEIAFVSKVLIFLRVYVDGICVYVEFFLVL